MIELHPATALALIEVFVLTTILLAFLAGYGIGRAQIAPKVAHLVATIEVARETGQLNIKRNLLDAALGEEPKSLTGAGGGTGTHDGKESVEEREAKAAIIEKGTERLMEDARKEGIPLRHAEARRLAADMVAEVL